MCNSRSQLVGSQARGIPNLLSALRVHRLEFDGVAGSLRVRGGFQRVFVLAGCTAAGALPGEVGRINRPSATFTGPLWSKPHVWEGAK